MVRSQYSETSQQVFVGSLRVQRLFLLEREKSLGPQDQQIPVESNWVWNINFPFGKQRNLHFWTIDSLPSRWPWLLTWNSFYFDEVHICLSFWVYLDLPDLHTSSHSHPAGWPLGWLAGSVRCSFLPQRQGYRWHLSTPRPWCVLCWVASVVSDSLWSHALEPARPLCPWDSPGKNTGVDCPTVL